MVNGNYVSLANVMWKVMKHGLCQELTYEEAAEYALECLKLLGAPSAYENKLYSAELVNYKASIPCDILVVNGVRYLDSKDAQEHNHSRFIAMREATNIYHFDRNEHEQDQNRDTDFDLRANHRNSEFTYKLQNGVIFTSMRDGCVEIAYKGLTTDEDGFPMIPDNEKVSLALEYYILSRYLEPMWLAGKITDKAFEYIQQKRYFYVPSAFTALQMPGIDMLESTMNSINRLVLSSTAHENFYKKAGEQERIRKFR